MIGVFEDETGIRYEQKYYVPYLGVNLGYTQKKFFVNLYLKGSLWAWSEGKDQHLQRDLEFEDEIDGQSYVGAGFEAGYVLPENFT